MRKFLFLTFFLIVIWAVNVWFVGNRSEQDLNAFIQKNNQLVKGKLFDLELISYHKNFLGATAEIIFHSNNSYIDQKLEGLRLAIKIHHGPFFINSSGVSIGVSKWSIEIAESEDSRVNSYSTSLVKETSPKVIARVSFDEKVHYSLMKNDSSLLDDMHGVYDFNNDTNDLLLSLKDIRFENNKVELATDEIQLRFLMEGGLSLENSLIRVDFQTPLLGYQQKGMDKPVKSSLLGKGEFIVRKGVISGNIDADFRKILGAGQLLDSAITELSFQGVSSKGVLHLLNVLEHVKDFKQQVTWVLEEQGEYPEGQDQIWQYYDQIKKITRQLPFIVKDEIMNSNSSIAFNIKLQGKGVSTITGALRSDVQEHKGKMLKTGGDVFLKKEAALKRKGTIRSLIEVILLSLQGHAKVSLNEDLYRVVLQNSAVKKRKFDLIWKDNKLLMK